MGGLKVVIRHGGNIGGLKVVIRLGGNIDGLKVVLSGRDDTFEKYPI